MRPELRKKLSASEFKDFYWLKKELQFFCRENGLSAAGAKNEITERIAVYLETGEIRKPMRKRRTTVKKAVLQDLSSCKKYSVN